MLRAWSAVPVACIVVCAIVGLVGVACNEDGGGRPETDDTVGSADLVEDTVGAETTPSGALLTVEVEGPGLVSAEAYGVFCPTACEARVPPGTTVVLQATPDLGAWVSAWTGACADAGDALEATVVVDADTTCGVRYEQLPVGSMRADIAASKEVVRERAAEADPGDSRVQLFANTGPSVAEWRWQVIDSETGQVRHTSTDENPTFDFEPGERGAYDVALTISDGVSSSRFRQRRLITVTLPRVPAGRTVHRVDLAQSSYFQEGKVNGQVVQPGDLVVVSGSISKNWAFFNFAGTPEAPIHVINDGLVENADTSWLLHLINCRWIIIDGFGDDAHPYGIRLANNTTDGGQAIFVRNYTQGNNLSTGSTGIEIFGVHVAAAPGTGVAVRTKGSEEFQRSNHRFDAFKLHHTKVENVGDEGFYIGYTRDWVGTSETHPAFKLYDARIYRNVIDSTGWDGLQVCNSVDVEVHDNIVTNAAVNRESYQSSSLQWNSGNSGAVYNNVFQGGTTSDLQVGCSGGDSAFFSNVFLQDNGLYIHGGLSDGPAYYLFANTIVATGSEAVRLNRNGGADSCADSLGSTASLSKLLALDNLALLANGAAFYRLVAGDPNGLTEVVEPNLSRDQTAVSDLCLADLPSGDVSITCPESAALDGSGATISGHPEIPASVLPMGLLTDITGRVVEGAGNYGAFQAP